MIAGAVASGLMSWVWPGRTDSCPAGSAAAVALAAPIRNGGLCSPVITSAGIVIVASIAAGRDRSPMMAAS